MVARDARLVVFKQLMLVALNPATADGPRVLALRTLMESMGVLGAKGQAMTGLEMKRAEAMTPAEMHAELEALREESAAH